MAEQPETFQVVHAEQVPLPVEGAFWRPTGRSFRATYRAGGVPVLLSVEIQSAPDAEWLPFQPPGVPESEPTAIPSEATP